MDTTSIIGMAVLLLAAVLLALLSSAETAITAISRGRMRSAEPNGAEGPLSWHLRRRHQLLRMLSMATTVTIVAGVATTMLLVLRGGTVSVLAITAVAIAAALVAMLLRQSARTLTLTNPERAGLRLARPIRVLQLLFAPLGWLAAAPIVALLRAFGRRTSPADEHPADELMAMLEATANADAEHVLVEERRMMRGIMAMSSKTVREIMSPRMDLVSASTDASIGDLMRLVIDSGFTRIPLYEESIDHVIGVIYAKDLLAYLQSGEQTDLREIARPPYFVPEAKRANELLAELRRDQVHMAIAVDEYGGTAGVITVEDLLEEIVGEIADEYDTDEVEVQQLSDDAAIVDARLPLGDLNELFGTDVDSEDFDTVGGLVVSLLGRLASPGDEVTSEQHGLELRVLSVFGRRIKLVHIERATPAADSEEEEAAV
ncbi:MAG: HlyC/CorC family transporter [Chloroflexi bacterium]|nr:HlyC/CorC family transporter [Chloroflexota bacterium]